MNYKYFSCHKYENFPRLNYIMENISMVLNVSGLLSRDCPETLTMRLSMLNVSYGPWLKLTFSTECQA